MRGPGGEPLVGIFTRPYCELPGGYEVSLPSGVICMWSGLLSAIPEGWALCDGTNGTPDLRGLFIKGAAAGVDPGVTGGGQYTPEGSVSAPTFTGNSLSTSSNSAGTPAGTNSAPAFTGTQAVLSHSGTAVADHAAHTHSVTSNVTGTLTPAGTIAWPAGVPTHSGITISDHASHTHTYTDVVNHTHTVTSVGSSASGSTTNLTGTSDTSSTTATTSNPSSGVAQGTTAGPSATLTHTVSSQGTVAWPAGVPTFTGTSNQALSMTNNAVTSGNPSATLTHSVTQPSDHTYTPQGTVAAPTFTGSALGTHSHTFTATGTISTPTFTGTPATVEPAFYSLAFIMKV